MKLDEAQALKPGDTVEERVENRRYQVVEVPDGLSKYRVDLRVIQVFQDGVRGQVIETVSYKRLKPPIPKRETRTKRVVTFLVTGYFADREYDRFTKDMTPYEKANLTRLPAGHTWALKLKFNTYETKDDALAKAKDLKDRGFKKITVSTCEAIYTDEPYD